MSTNQSLVGTAMAMTQQAPTAIVQEAKARAEARYADAQAVANVVGLAGAGAALLMIAGFGLVMLIGWYRRMALAEPEQDEPELPAPVLRRPAPVTVAVYENSTSNYAARKDLQLPPGVTQDMLVFMACAETWHKWNLAYNRYAAAGAGWHTGIMKVMRDWLVENGYAEERGSRLEKTDAGVRFFAACTNEERLPTELVFTPKDAESPVTRSRVHDLDGKNDGGGVGESGLVVIQAEEK
jgi:hypothetical protein